MATNLLSLIHPPRAASAELQVDVALRQPRRPAGSGK